METQNSYQSISGRGAGMIFIALFFVLVFLSGKVFSQETDTLSQSVSADSVQYSKRFTVQTGTTPLSSGLACSVMIQKSKSSLILDLNKSMGQLVWLYTPAKNISVGLSGGFFNQVLWFGPLVSINLFNGHFSTLHWVGWSMGDTEEGITGLEVPFCFSYQQIALNWAGFEASYVLFHYQKEAPENIFNLKKTFNVDDNLCIFGSGGYMFKKDKIIFAIGMNYSL